MNLLASLQDCLASAGLRAPHPHTDLFSGREQDAALCERELRLLLPPPNQGGQHLFLKLPESEDFPLMVH